MTWLMDFIGGRYLKLAAAVAVVALIALAGWRVSAWHSAYEALPEAQAALEAEQACQEPSECWRRVQAAVARQEAVSAEVVQSYENELEALRARPVERRVIRVCRSADPGDVRHAVPAGPADGTGTAPGVVHGAAEFDTGPLFDLAREADELAARLRALQQWNEALATPK